MRLYGMYYICKKYIGIVESMKLETKTVNGSTVKYVSKWDEKSIVLNELAKLVPVRERVRKLYETVPVVHRDQKQFDLSSTAASNYITARTELVIAMQTMIDLYENINSKSESMEYVGFDVKLPDFEDVGEFAECLKDFDFIMKQCPYLNLTDSEIKYGSVDVGSTWITFLVAGAAATTIIVNLGKIIDAAVKIKSHIKTVKMQEEALRSIEIKNELATEVLDAFKKTSKVITQQSVAELEAELGALKDGEEKDKAGRSLEKLGYWMDKGMQFYSTIDAPVDIKDVFPKQEEVNFISNDLLKLLEMKNDK